MVARKNSSNQVRRMVLMSMLLAVMIVLAFTPIGMIPIGPVYATTVHIPVLIAVLSEGLSMGMGMGLAFGLLSLIRAYVMPTTTSFLFMDPRVAILPRLLVPLVTYCGAMLLRPVAKKWPKARSAVWGASAFIGTMTNTVCVLLMIYWLYAAEYAQALGVQPGEVTGLLLSTASINGTLESVLSMLVVPAVLTAFTRIAKRR